MFSAASTSRTSTEKVLLVSFAAHGVTDVVHEIAAAADRGVEVDLVLESTVDQGGRLRRGAGAGAFDVLADRATFWHWFWSSTPRSRC